MIFDPFTLKTVFINCRVMNLSIKFENLTLSRVLTTYETRSSADADNALDAFSGQSRPCGISDGTLTHVRHMTNVVTLKLGSDFTQGH